MIGVGFGVGSAAAIARLIFDSSLRSSSWACPRLGFGSERGVILAVTPILHERDRGAGILFSKDRSSIEEGPRACRKEVGAWLRARMEIGAGHTDMRSELPIAG
jgi:hypothetical protein